VVSGDQAVVGEAIARLELVADTFLSVATPVQLALPHWLRQAPAVKRAVVERLRANVAALDEVLRESGPDTPVRRLPIHGGWYGVLEVPRTRDEDAWVEILVREEGVIVHPGYFFDFERDGFLVVSLLPVPNAFRDGIARVLRRLTS
jgi:aspartate/methionine/tyrosine aminotransferase